MSLIELLLLPLTRYGQNRGLGIKLDAVGFGLQATFYIALKIHFSQPAHVSQVVNYLSPSFLTFSITTT